MDEIKRVQFAVWPALSDRQIRKLPRGSLRHPSAGQLPPGDGESVGQRLRVVRALSIARHRPSCGAVENGSATRQVRAVSTDNRLEHRQVLSIDKMEATGWFFPCTRLESLNRYRPSNGIVIAERGNRTCQRQQHQS